MKGLVFNIETASLNDGPGIRTTVFMKGCPLNCIWCHNPESKSNKVQVFARKPEFQSQLVKDWAAHGINQKQELTFEGPDELSNEQKEKYQLSGKWWDVEKLFLEVLKDKPFFSNSGGGVTISGGEPLLQAEFVAALLQRFKNEKVHTCVDTSGFATESQMQLVLPHTNLFLFDLKIHEGDLHRILTGQSNQTILNNLKIINRAQIPVIIRVPLIAGINAVPEFLQFLQMIKKEYESVTKIELLPYHDDYLGKPCYTSTREIENNRKQQLQKPDDDLLASWKKALQ